MKSANHEKLLIILGSRMDILEKLLRPEVIGPMIGLVAVIGGICIGAAKLYFNHEERIEKIKAGIDPDKK
jgi:hypothetical protein